MRNMSRLLISAPKFSSFSRVQRNNSVRTCHIHIERLVTRAYQNPSLQNNYAAWGWDKEQIRIWFYKLYIVHTKTVISSHSFQ